MMVMETACSHAPPPATRAEVDSTIQGYEGTGTVVRIHTISGITIVTSHYSTTDSTVVIHSILRDSKYYNPTEAKLHEQELKPPPRETVLPLDVPFSQIKFIEKWESRSVVSDVGAGVAIMVLIVAAVVLGLFYALRSADGESN